MTACFCGCGREIPRFPLGMRSINKRGQHVIERLEWGEAVRDGMFANWVGDGAIILADLEAAMHGEIDPRALDESSIRQWQKIGRLLEAGIVDLGGPPLNAWLAPRP